MCVIEIFGKASKTILKSHLMCFLVLSKEFGLNIYRKLVIGKLKKCVSIHWIFNLEYNIILIIEVN